MFSASLSRKVCNEIKSKESVPDFPYVGKEQLLIPRDIRAKNKTKMIKYCWRKHHFGPYNSRTDNLVPTIFKS